MDQASKRLIRENVEHGVYMAGHWNVNKKALIQICSIDTLISRKEYPPAKLVVIDEADQATSKAYIDISNHYKEAFFLPVTATPYSDKSLKHIAQKIIQPIGFKELVEKGYLVAPKYYAPQKPDLIGVKVVKKEFENKELEQRMTTLTGGIVSHWKALSQNRATVCFAVSIKHSREICETFNASGIPAMHCDADTEDNLRDEIIKKLETGEIKVICNVGILCRGVDIPFLGCIIMARPTRSYNLFIQQLGRGTRTFPGKNDFIVLDHASNLIRHGFIDLEPAVALDGSLPKLKILVKTCQDCFLVYQGSHCPQCGPKEKEIEGRIPEIVAGSLEEVLVKEEDHILMFIRHAKKTAKVRGYKQSWVWYELIRRYGIEKAEPHLPFWFNQYRIAK